MAYQDVILQDAPYVYYKLDETSGTTVANLGSKGGTGSITANVARSQAPAGTIGGFSAKIANSVISNIATTSYAYNGSTFTFECWFKRDTAFSGASTLWELGAGLAQITISNAGYFRIFNTAGLNDGYTLASLADGNWHHIAAVRDGTTWSWYADGVLLGTKYGAGAATTATVYNGNRGNSGSPHWTDEIAMYNTALSPERIAAHYQAGSSQPGISISTLAPAMVVNLSSVAPVIKTTKGIRVAAPAMVMSATAPAPVVTAVNSNIQVLSPTADAGSGITTGGTATTVDFGQNSFQGALLFKFPTATIPAGKMISSAVLELTRGSTPASSTSYKLHQMDRALNESDTNSNRWSNIELGSGTIPSGPSGGKVQFDVTAALTSGSPYGFALVHTSGSVVTFHMRETTTAANRPTLTVTLADIPQVPAISTVTGPMVVNVTMPQHRVGTGVKSIVVGSAAASISAPAPVASAVKNVRVQVPAVTLTMQFPGGVSRNPDQLVKPDPFEMWLYSPNPTQYISVDVKSTAPAMELSLSGTSDNNINLKTEKRVFVTNPMTMKLNMVGIYQREADRYLAIVPSTVDGDDRWYQMEETSGTIADDSVFDAAAPPNPENNRQPATYVGGPTFGVEGPKLRKAVAFDGVDDHLVMATYSYSIWDHTVEFSIRTTQQNGIIYRGGAPRSTATTGVTPAYDVPDGLRVLNGELVLVVGYTDPTKPLIYRTGKYIADGEWHHVVFSQPNPGPAQGMFAFGISVSRQTFLMVDGNIEWARYLDYSGATLPLPYKVMGGFYTTGPSQALKGEMRDFIVRTNYAVSQNTATKLYYEWSESTVIRSAPMTLNLSMRDPYKAKGNTKRMIVLYGLPYALKDGSGRSHARDGWGNYTSVFANYYIQTNNGDVTVATGEIHNWAGYPHPTYNNPTMVYFHVRPFRLENFMCYPVAIATQSGSRGPHSSPGMEKDDLRDHISGQILDNKTGLPRFINLQEDLREDITNFDAITAVNYPAVQAEENNVSADPLREFRQHNLGLNSGEWTIARDRLRDSILEALYDGVSLWGNEPHMAQHLGFIQAWDKHATGARYEFFGPGGIDATGLTNYRAMELDANHLADGVFILPPSGTRLTTDYNPTWQANAKRQIVNLEPGLTDIPGYEMKDRIKVQKANVWEPHAQVIAWDIMDRMAGLQTGDQLLMDMWEQNEYTGNYPGSMAPWSAGIPRRFIISAKPEGIVGKVISKEMDFYYVSRGAVQQNPWRNNVYTIAAERGSVVRGRPIGGRAFFDFMDTEIGRTKIAEDRNKTMWNGLLPLAGTNQPESRWSFDSRRYKQVIITTIIDKTLTRSDTMLVNVKTEERYIEMQDPDLIYRPFISMNARGLNWLAKADTVPVGDVRISTTAMQINLSAGDVAIKRTLNSNVKVTGTMRLDIDLRQPKNYRGNDFRDKTPPMVMNLEMRGTGKVVKAEPMVLNLSMAAANVTGSGDKIYVYMDADRNVRLYIREE